MKRESIDGADERGNQYSAIKTEKDTQYLITLQVNKLNNKYSLKWNEFLLAACVFFLNTKILIEYNFEINVNSIIILIRDYILFIYWIKLITIFTKKGVRCLGNIFRTINRERERQLVLQCDGLEIGTQFSKIYWSYWTMLIDISNIWHHYVWRIFITFILTIYGHYSTFYFILFYFGFFVLLWIT